MVPIAPFTAVNLVAGASRIRFSDFILGNVLGMSPGMLLMTAMGHQVFLTLIEPTALSVAILVAIVLGWIALSIALQFALLRIRGRRRI
jgi:uncharacterized membrane protein YdjX (TVP38/TMEM64 family)